jgi:replication factor C small subunit
MDIKHQKNVAWIVKYRPKNVKDVVGEEAKLVQRFIDNESVPHFLFESRTPGTGKSSLSKAIINDMGSDYLEINSSMDRGIDVIREKIVHFVQTMSSKPGIKKIVFMDEFDGITKPAQESMRNLMETYMHNVIFILTCNHIEKVIDPIKNRCEVVRFGNPKKEDVHAYLEGICKAEDVKYTEKGLNKLIDIYYPSIRNMVGELQRFKTLDVEVNEQFVKKDEERFDAIWEDLKKGKVLVIRDKIMAEGIEPDVLLKHFFQKTIVDKDLTNKQVINVSKVLAEINYRMAVGSDKTIQMLCGLFEIYIGLKKG